MNTPPSDQGIPILTEVIGPQEAPEPAIPPLAKASPAPTATIPAATRRDVPPASSVPISPATAVFGTPTSTPWKDSELGDLERDLRERITRQVLGRIDFVLDHRVRNTLTDVVDSAIDALAVEIKRGLHDTLTDIVARAVAQEISRLQTAKK